MVTVGDVEGLDVFEQRAELRGDFRVADDPAAGEDVVFRREVVDRFLCRLQLFDERRDVFVLPIGQEDGTGVGVAGRNVLDAVDFLASGRNATSSSSPAARRSGSGTTSTASWPPSEKSISTALP